MVLLDHFDDSTCSVEDTDNTQPFDERKPRVPYAKGWRFTAQQHNPPPPIQIKPSVGCTFKSMDEAQKMEELHPFEQCRQYPPLPGSCGSSSLELQVHETIRIGDHHNSQVVLVEVLTANSIKGLSPGQYAVAKLYDPMYIDDDGFYINPFLAADKLYTHEAAAYMALSDLQGSVIPQYYGSYSLDIPIPLESTEDKRSVRLIIIELIPGSSMQNTDPNQFSQETRQNIMEFLIEFESLVYSRNILLRDLHPRNVMVTTYW